MTGSATTLLAQMARQGMLERLPFVVPEIILFIATCVVMIVGLSPNRSMRKACAGVSILGLIGAGIAAALSDPSPGSLLPNLIPFAKTLIAGVGVLLIMLITGTVDREYEARIARGSVFDAIRSNRAEFYAFALFSLTGLMLCASADDLVWLFLALELTSLPTYVMVSISTARARSQEAGVKYFFLGAFGAATFLMGFALIYGATGTTWLPGVSASLASTVQATGSLGAIATLGLILAIVGVSFKIAAVPMHFYAPDVYEGASTSVAAFLAFVPKTAGFLTLILLLSAVGWGFDGGLPEPIRVTLWAMAALTMTVGNVLAVLQSSVKRILAYSSVAHSGYMLVGLIAGPGAAPDGRISSNGLAAVLFYLLCYGFMNLGAFAVLACLEKEVRPGEREEIETVDDLRGLWRTNRLMAAVMVLCAASLLGFPPLLGFFGKLYLFTSAISAGEIALVIIMGVNSAIAAFYYLRLMATPLLENQDERAPALHITPSPGRVIAAVASAVSVLALVIPIGALMQRSAEAASLQREPMRATGSGGFELEPVRSAPDHAAAISE